MLHYKNPDVLHISDYDGRIAVHRRAPEFSIGKTGRFVSRSASAAGRLGPGQYRVDRDYPSSDDMAAWSTTSAKTPLSFSFSVDGRVAPDGTLKGIARKNQTDLGPGHYEQPAARNIKGATPSYSIPRTKESAEALRERKRRVGNVGPGDYDVPRAFDRGGRERQQQLERLAKSSHGSDCWAAAQYSHVFDRMKPQPVRGTQSSPALATAAVLALQELTASQPTTPKTPKAQ